MMINWLQVIKNISVTSDEKLLPLTPDWIGLKLSEKRMIEVIEELPEMKCLFHFKDIKNAAKYPLPAFPRVIVQLC